MQLRTSTERTSVAGLSVLPSMTQYVFLPLLHSQNLMSKPQRSGPDNYRRDDRRDDRYRDDRRDDRYRRERSRSPPRRGEHDDRRPPRSPPSRREVDDKRPAGYDDYRCVTKTSDDKSRRSFHFSLCFGSDDTAQHWCRCKNEATRRCAGPIDNMEAQKTTRRAQTTTQRTQ